MNRPIKPILIVKVPSSVLTQEQHRLTYLSLEDRFKEDYEILVIPLYTKQEIEIQVIFDKDIEESDLESLRKEILDEIQRDRSK